MDSVQSLTGISAGVYKVTVGRNELKFCYIFDFNTRTVWQEQTEEFPYEFVHNFFDIDTAEIGQKLVFTAAIVGLEYAAVHIAPEVLEIEQLENELEKPLSDAPIRVNGLWFEKLPNGFWRVLGTNAKVTEEELFAPKVIEITDKEAWELQLFNVNRTDEENR